jgi:hypothetical protein
MLFLALTTLEKLQRVPVEFWLRIVMIISVFTLTIVLIRGISQMNKVVLTMTIFVVVTVFGFSWIYERSEPKMFTPLINKIAPFFPSKNTTNRW